jgi:RES domain-containing protein
MIVYRMHAASRGVFDTTGAFLYAGRWHSQGTRVVYAAEHASLAALETLIHAGGRKIPPRVITQIYLPDDLAIENSNWMDLPDSRAFGDAWARQKRGAILRVPSIAVNGMESNLLLNPAHPAFSSIQAEPPQGFVFNSRFFAAL